MVAYLYIQLAPFSILYHLQFYIYTYDYQTHLLPSPYLSWGTISTLLVLCFSLFFQYLIIGFFPVQCTIQHWYSSDPFLSLYRFPYNDLLNQEQLALFFFMNFLTSGPLCPLLCTLMCRGRIRLPHQCIRTFLFHTLNS